MSGGEAPAVWWEVRTVWPTLCPSNRWFSELLALKSHGLVHLSQPQPYADMDVGVTQAGLDAVLPQLTSTRTQSQ